MLHPAQSGRPAPSCGALPACSSGTSAGTGQRGALASASSSPETGSRHRWSRGEQGGEKPQSLSVHPVQYRRDGGARPASANSGRHGRTVSEPGTRTNAQAAAGSRKRTGRSKLALGQAAPSARPVALVRKRPPRRRRGCGRARDGRSSAPRGPSPSAPRRPSASPARTRMRPRA